MTAPVLLTRRGADVPWGFRLHGGTDQHSPLTVQRVTPGSVASMSLAVGDEILRIGNTDASRVTYAVAMETIKNCGDRLELHISRTEIPKNTQPFSNYSHSPYTPNDVGETKFDSFNQSPSQVHDRHTQGHVGRPEREKPKQQVASPVQPQVPDTVLNTSARTAQEKRPWAYAPDIQSLQQQRSRVQRRNLAPAKVVSPQRPTNQFVSPHRHQPHRMTSQPQDGGVEQNGEGSHENIYSGADIPSKTFQLLQSFTSSPNQSAKTDLARAAQRRRSRREKLHNFENDVRDRAGKSQEPEFNEADYLAGRIPIIGTGSTKPVPRPAYTEARIEPEQEREDENKKPFDERAYLAGRIPLVRGGPINPAVFNPPTPDVKPDAAVREEDEPDENKKLFDERAYLAGRIPLVRGGTIDPTQFSLPQRRVVKKYKEVNRPRLKQPFDESAYLAGKLNILGQTTDRPPRAPVGSSIRTEDVKPSWCKGDEEMVSEDEYDEESFLKGRIAIVRRSVDRDLPQSRAPIATERLRYSRERAARERDGLDDAGRGGICSDTEFDERAFLAGRLRRQHLIPDKEYSTDTETAAIPSKTFQILRRSVSSERSAEEDWRSSTSGASGLTEDETGGSSDQEKPYDCYMYHGRKIPSKVFSRLKKTMDRKAAAEQKASPADPIERLKQKSLENVGIDVDTAIERLEIGKHDPDKYMELLKQSVEENDIRIEPDNEVTDF